jgi:hypothetical protein
MSAVLVRGEEWPQMPADLYIPPDALEVILESFAGPLDLLLYLIRRDNIDYLAPSQREHMEAATDAAFLRSFYSLAAVDRVGSIRLDMMDSPVPSPDEHMEAVSALVVPDSPVSYPNERIEAFFALAVLAEEVFSPSFWLAVKVSSVDCFHCCHMKFPFQHLLRYMNRSTTPNKRPEALLRLLDICFPGLPGSDLAAWAGSIPKGPTEDFEGAVACRSDQADRNVHVCRHAPSHTSEQIRSKEEFVAWLVEPCASVFDWRRFPWTW